MSTRHPRGVGRPVAGRRSAGGPDAVPAPLRDALTAGLINAADVAAWRARWTADPDSTVVALAALIPEDPMPDRVPAPPPALVAALHGQVDLAAYAMAAAAAKPWGTGDPITWAVATGRILVDGAEKWRTYVDDNPDVGLPVLAALEPVLDPRLTAMASALPTNTAEEDELAEFDHLQPPNRRVRKPEEEDGSEFDELYPPNMRHGRQDDTLDPALAEFDGLYPPNQRWGADTFGLTEAEYQARLGGH